MKKEGHVIVALSVIVAVYFIVGKFFQIPTDWLQYSFAFVLGNLAPDIIDSASSPVHRTILGHSYKTVKILLFFLIPFSVYLALTKSIIYFHIISFLLGFLVHLGVDSFSKFGLVK